MSDARTTPVIIGIAGGSGSGKTTVVRRLRASLGDDQVSVLEHDRYYRDRSDLRLEERAALNYDHPDSLETDLLVEHVTQLRTGHGVAAPQSEGQSRLVSTAWHVPSPHRGDDGLHVRIVGLHAGVQ